MTDVSSLAGQVVCADALDFLRGLPDKCVDWVITDPPYGMNIGDVLTEPPEGRISHGKAVARKRKGIIYMTPAPAEILAVNLLRAAGFMV